MFLSRLFRRSRAGDHATTRKRLPQHGSRCRLRLEGLEDRTVLATLHHFSIQHAAASTVAGAVVPLTVVAQDVNNDVVTDYTGTIHFNTLDLQGILPHDFTFTLADQGVHAFNAQLFTTGPFAIRVTDVSNQALHGSTGRLLVAAAAFDHFDFIAPKTVHAGAVFSIGLIAKDSFGNTVSNYTGTVYFNSSDGNHSYRQRVTFTDGDLGARNFAVIMRTAGLQAIRIANVGDQSLHGSVQLQVVPNDAAHFEISINSEVTQGVPVTVVVSAFDAYGNIAKGFNGTVHFNSSDPNSTLPADYTFTAADEGRHRFSVTFGSEGTQVIRVSDVGTPQAMFGNVEVFVKSGRSALPGGGSRTLLSAPAMANSAPAAYIVRLHDQINERNVGKVNGTRAILAQATSEETPLPAVLLSGALEVELTLNTPGLQTITATSAENSEISSSVNIVVVPSAARTIVNDAPTAFTSKGSNRPLSQDDGHGPVSQQEIRPNRRTVKRVVSKRDDMFMATALS